MEAPDQNHPGGRAEQHSSGVPVQRLRLPLRDDFVKPTTGRTVGGPGCRDTTVGALIVRRPTKSVGRGQWLPIMSVVVFLMAAAGAGFALYTILPVFMDEHGKYSLARFAVILVATFLLIVVVARLRRR